jgi:hypothetical protein
LAIAKIPCKVGGPTANLLRTRQRFENASARAGRSAIRRPWSKIRNGDHIVSIKPTRETDDMERGKLSRTMIEHIGVSFGARGIEAAREYATNVSDAEYSTLELVKHIADRLGLSGSDLLRIADETKGCVAILERKAEELERTADELSE